MSFWEKQKENVLAKKLQRAKSLIRASHPDFKTKHPDEVRDGNTSPPNFSKMIIRVTKEVKTAQKQYQDRRNKIEKDI